MARSAATARSARYSWMAPTVAFSTTITTIAIASWGSPITPETTAAARSTRIMKSRSWLPSSARGERRLVSAISLPPYSARRRAASSLDSPRSTSLESLSATSVAERACHG